MEDVSQRAPRVTAIIPSWDGHRDGCVPRLLESIDRQTYQDFEVRLVKAVSPQGKAINQGASEARGEILIILDDDSRLAGNTVFETLVRALDDDPGIGMAGASIVLPPESNTFQQRAARQFPRYNMPVVDNVVDSDFACHGCCAIRTEVFNAVGREREDIIRGLDPDLRVRLRCAGYRVVLVPNTIVYHPLPGSWSKLLRMFFRNGYGSAYAQKFQPDSVYETHERLSERGFQPRTSLVFRALRFPGRLLRALAEGKTLRFGAYVAYATGYAWGFLTSRRIADDRSANQPNQA